MSKEFNNFRLISYRNRIRYLESTDWLVIRNTEKGVAIDPAITIKRQQARDEASTIRDSSSIGEIELLTKEF